MAERIGRAVLELTTDASGLLSGFAKIEREGKGVETEFERLRQRSRDLGRDLQRAVEGFEGQPVINKARTMAQAIEQVGGVSKLTKRELADVASTVAAATDKLERMGQEVPPSLRKLSTEIHALDAGSTKAASGLSSMAGTLGGLKALLPALGIAGAVGLIVSMGAAALQSADKFVTFAERADVSVETTQRWAYVAGQTSTSLEAFGQNAFNLGVNVSAGTDKVRAAVSELGLSYADLRAQRPEQQFDTVIEKLEGVEKATDRNRLGQALFGREFKEIAVAVSEGYTRMKDDASVSSEEQVRAAEAAGDAWEQVKQQIGAAALSVVGGLSQYVLDTIAAMKLLAANREDFTAGQQAMIDQIRAAGGEGLAALMASFGSQAKDINLAGSAVTDYTAKLREVRAEVAALTPAQREQIDAASQLTGVTDELADELGVSIEALRLYTSESKKKTKATDEDAKAEERRLAILKQIALGDYFEKLYGTAVRADISATSAEINAEIQAHEGTEQVLRFGVLESVGITAAAWVQQYVPALAASEAGTKRLTAGTLTLAQTLKGQLLSSLQQVPQTLAQALVSGGGLSGAAKAITSNLGSNLAKWGAAALGFTGPWGQAIAGAVGSLTPLISKLWGGNAEHKRVNDLRDDFTKAAGGIHQLNVKAKEAGLTLDRFLRAKTVKEYEAAIAELEAAFDRLAENKEKAGTLFDEIMAAGAEGIPAAMRSAIEQMIALGLLTDEQAEKLRGLADATGPSVQQMEQALGVIKGRMESLGPAFKQAKITETAGQYVNAIQTMIDGGGDVGGILFDAREELGALVADSIRSGTTLPANLKPWIDNLVESGNLIDENGEKITDVSGLKYGERMKTEAEKAKEGWDKILSKIQELIDRITGPLQRSIDNLPDEHNLKIRVDSSELDRVRRDDEFRTTPVGPGEQASFEAGIFRGRFSAAGTLARLHNVESVVPQRAEVAFATRVLAERLPPVAPGAGGGMTVVPFAVFYPDGNGRVDLSAINRHLASSAGIAGNNFGLREVIEALALGVYQREFARRG